MKVSYKARIKRHGKRIQRILNATVKIYRSAIKYIIKILETEYDTVKSLPSNQQVNEIEHLIHNTKDNKAKYDFDTKFYKFPSYLRREAIKTSLGIYSSWNSNYEKYLTTSKTTMPPKLTYDHAQMPVMYKDNMYVELEGEYVKIKVYDKNDWVWLEIELDKSDLKYIDKYDDWTKSNPTLEKKGKIWYLRYCFTKNIELNTTQLENQIIVGVDLNVKNTSAVVCAMNKTGTVISRKFINCGKEKDQLNKAIQIKTASQKRCKIKKVYNDEPELYNYNNYKSKYRIISNRNKELAIQIARSIIEFALNNNADIIVFEHLDKKGKKRFLKEKLHYWNCKMVQNITTSLAHKKGLHVRTVCAWGTSKYAFDGSGEVNRHSENRSIATFKNGKVYNADLSASYNIASRYFIKEIQKSTPVKVWLDAVAKVPSASSRITHTLDTLINLEYVL